MHPENDPTLQGVIAAPAESVQPEPAPERTPEFVMRERVFHMVDMLRIVGGIVCDLDERINGKASADAYRLKLGLPVRE
jgi:hypothetical protein